MRIALIMLLVIGCGRLPKKVEIAVPSDSDRLRGVAAFYEKAVLETQDEDGFLFTDRCDSLLFSGLYGAQFPERVNLTAAEEAPGRWLRRPSRYGECERPLSRDAVRGVLFWAVFRRDAATVHRLWDFAASNAGRVDSGADSILTPYMWGQMARIRKALGDCPLGCEAVAAASPSPQWTPGAHGYVAHLRALDDLMEAHLSGSAPEGGAARAAEALARNRENPLHAALLYRFTGDEEALRTAESALLHPRWPSDSLPDSGTLCDEWPMQREMGADWQPCPVTSDPADYRGAAAAWLFSYFVLTSDKIGRGGPSNGELGPAITQANHGVERARRTDWPRPAVGRLNPP